MSQGGLQVIHVMKDPAISAGAPLSCPREGAIFLDSCQRWLWIGLAGQMEPIGTQGLAQTYSGSDAYTFLLSVATGLESQVIGETDIFGQLKDAWNKQRVLLGTEARKELSAWMQRLFEDTKEIRSRYLQNLGGSSYGSLLRKILKDAGSLVSGPTVLIGAGQLASSVAPYLLDHELWIVNRTAERAQALAFELQEQNPGAKIRAFGAIEEIEAIAQAAQLVICAPEDSEQDPRRVQALRSGVQVVHLGMRATRGPWSGCEKFYSLEDIFKMDRSLSAVRSLQVEKARAACREKAILRALGGGSVSIAHGWEDLAAFVS